MKDEDIEEIKKMHDVSWDQFERGVLKLIEMLLDFEDICGRKFLTVYGIPRGGLCLATKLSYLLDRPLIVNVNEITKDTLVVDDCTNTGKTLMPFQEGGYKTMTFVHKPNKSGLEPTFYCFTTNRTINFCWESKYDTN